eukprot:2046851-Pyramimonas_sp.AAC.1
MGAFVCVPPTQDRALWLHWELHRRPQSGCSHAPHPHRTALRGRIGNSTEGTSGDVRMRLPHPGQRFVAP